MLVGVQGGVGQGIDAALGEHEGGIAPAGGGEPQALLAARRKAGEAFVLHLVAAGSVPVGMGKDGIAPGLNLG